MFVAEIAAAGQTCRQRELKSPCGRLTAVDGREMLKFASDDYLRLAGHGDIAQALAEGASPWEADSSKAIFADKLNHASLIDVVQQAKASGLSREFRR